MRASSFSYFSRSFSNCSSTFSQNLEGDIRRFGPAILFATEGFECWNTIFRLCSVLSNHQAPSHDIGVTLADMERFKHQVSGGWWKPDGSHEYVQAGHEIIAFLQRNKELQRRLGWMDKSKPKPGSIKLDSRRTAVSAPWREGLGPLWTPELDFGAGKIWTTCKYVVSQSGDVCTKGTWETDNVRAGRISIILLPANASMKHSEAVVVICQFIVSTTRDARMNMPVLSPSPEIHLAEPGAILFCFNAQHDCYGSKCHAVGGFENREAKRNEFAALLQVSGPAKRAATAKKAKET
ncbi:hypothetical protein FB451DRAFT_1189821 [Mycena latifolia]|nr:hypothetical protein FB451DRAFT_1189821 [Mycena latifolia]